MKPKQIFVTQHDVYTMLGLSRTGLSKLRARDPLFPLPIKDGTCRQSSVYFVADEIQAWIDNRIASRTGDAA